MSIETAALIHARHATFTARFKPKSAAEPGQSAPELQGEDGKLFRLFPLEDGCIAWTDLDFASDPADLAAALRRMFGDALDLHDDPRGLFVFPTRARPRSQRYNDAVDELGELGSWARVPTAAEAEAHTMPAPRAGVPLDDEEEDTTVGMPDFGFPTGAGGMDPMALMQQLGGLLSAIPPEAMAAMQQAMSAGEMSDPNKVMERLQGAMGAGGMEKLQESLMGALSTMDPSVLENLQAATGMDPNASEADMLEQAQAQLEELRTKDPARFAEIQKQMGGAFPFPPDKKR